MLGLASGFKWDLLYSSLSGESPSLVEAIERHRPAEGAGVPLLWWIIALPVWTPAPPPLLWKIPLLLGNRETSRAGPLPLPVTSPE